MIEFINPPELAGRAAPFSRATKAAGLVFVSGHSAPHDPEGGKPRPETPQGQVREALATLDLILRAAGSDLARVVQVTMLITMPAMRSTSGISLTACPHGTPCVSACRPKRRSRSRASRWRTKCRNFAAGRVLDWHCVSRLA
jgi:enamine deaminase RidA (YjgF/YER057c/UK114 family)